MLFTSGTTGLSKGVVRTRRMVMDHAAILAEGAARHADRDAPPPFLVTAAPVYHTAAFVGVLKMAALGGGVGLLDRLEAAAVLELAERHRATELLLVPPASYDRLASCPERGVYDLSTVREVLATAGGCTPRTAASIFDLFPNADLRVSWGSTETGSVTGGLITRAAVARKPEILTCVGRPNALTEIRLVAPDAVDAAPGSVGEAWVRSPLVAAGYLGDRETDPSFRDGWFATGDLLRRGEDGAYCFVDRLKDLVKTGGENVYAFELEQALARHPSIRECAVVGVPDPLFGEAVAVAVVLVRGASLTGRELTAFARSRLESYKKPRYWGVLDRLPTNAVGKVDKAELRARAAQLFSPLTAGRGPGEGTDRGIGADHV
jgi:long-chain acyl-CoA synthetase